MNTFIFLNDEDLISDIADMKAKNKLQTQGDESSSLHSSSFLQLEYKAFKFIGK